MGTFITFGRYGDLWLRARWWWYQAWFCDNCLPVHWQAASRLRAFWNFNICYHNTTQLSMMWRHFHQITSPTFIIQDELFWLRRRLPVLQTFFALWLGSVFSASRASTNRTQSAAAPTTIRDSVSIISIPSLHCIALEIHHQPHDNFSNIFTQ